MSKSTKIKGSARTSSLVVQHPKAAKRGRTVGLKLRGAKRKGQQGALAVKSAVVLVAGSIGAFATAFWKAV